MKRSLRRIIFGLVPAALAALVVGIPTAASDVSLQPVTVACAVDSPFTLAADPYTVTQLTLALAAMTDPACALTQTAPTADPDPDFAVGGGLDSGGQHFSFSAHQNTPNPPSGYAHVKGPPGFFTPFGAFDVQGHVTCLTFPDPITAVFGFEIEKGTGQGTNLGAEFFVRDNGPPGSTPPDFFSPVLFTPTVPVVCPTITGTGVNTVIQGNIVVK
jgi:hypothetical protein